MNYKKESQFTNNASKRVFEEVYTNEDMPDSMPVNGVYRLNVPQMFANNPSQEKAMSPRRVMCEPKPHYFSMRVVYTNDNGDDITPSYSRYKITSETTLEEMLVYIESHASCKTDSNDTYAIRFDCDKLTGNLSIYALKNSSDMVPFRFSCRHYKGYKEFWDFLNQTGNPFFINENNPDNYNENSMAATSSITLSNVWSREPLYVHSTFSNSKKHYLCRTGDFWFKPSKYYYDNINQNDFEIFFTTDGSHRIVPHDAVKVIEICFILRQFARL